MGINLNNLGYQETRAAVHGAWEVLQPDAYKCVIVNAELSESKKGLPMLVFFVDICEGEYSGHFKRSLERARGWNREHRWDNAAIYRRTITADNGKISPHFKGFIECIEISNPGYHINADNFEPRDLIGKKCGFVFGENEFRKHDDTIGTSVYIAQPVSTVDVANGNYKIPPLKKLDDKNKPQPQPAKKSADDYYYNNSAIDDSDVPF